MRVRIHPSDRRTGLGASEVASVAGVSPWRTPLDTWLSKVEGNNTDVPNEYQRWGLEIEGLLVQQAVHRLGHKARRNSMTYSHPDWPIVRLFATPDGLADHGRVLVEAKVVNNRYAEWADGSIPAGYEMQGLVQLACWPAADKVLFVALIGGRLEYRELPRPDPAVLEDLVEQAMRWWANYVVREVVPPPVNDEDRWTIVRRRAATSAGFTGERMTRLATPDEEAAAVDLLTLRERIDELQAEADATRLRLAELSADSDLAGNRFKATWSMRSARDYRAAWNERTGQEPLSPDHITIVPVFTVRSVKETNE